MLHLEDSLYHYVSVPVVGNAEKNGWERNGSLGREKRMKSRPM